MKYKMLVSDFDGTLTDKSGKVPQENIDAIRAYTEAGGFFTLSTGRMHESIEKRLDELGLRGQNIPLISYQGAVIRDIGSGALLHSVPMNRDTVRKILRYCAANNLYCQYYSFDKLYVGTYCETAKFYAEYTDVVEHTVVTGGLEPFLDAHPDMPVCKIVVMDKAEKIHGIERELNRHFDGEGVFSQSAAIISESVSP